MPSIRYGYLPVCNPRDRSAGLSEPRSTTRRHIVGPRPQYSSLWLRDFVVSVKLHV